MAGDVDNGSIVPSRSDAGELKHCGELLKEIEARPGKRTDLEPSTGNESQAATEATAPPSRRLGLHNTHTATPFLPPPKKLQQTRQLSPQVNIKRVILGERSKLPSQ